MCIRDSVMNVAEDDRVTAVAIAAHGKKKCAANADGCLLYTSTAKVVFRAKIMP